MKGLQRVALPCWCATVALIDNPTALTCFMSSTASRAAVWHISTTVGRGCDAEPIAKPV